MGAGRHGAAATPWERDRAEFAALMERLGSDDEQTRLNARLDLERFPYEDAVRHLAALWPEKERKRRRNMPWFRFLIGVAMLAFPLKIVLLILIPPEGAQWILPRMFLTVLAGSCWIAALGLPHTSRCQKGMSRVLADFPDVRLTGALADALSGEIRGANPDAAEKLRAKLADLLPRHRAADLPPLDAHQRKVLLGEVRREAKRLRRKADREMPDDRARFLVAALDALGWEALRAGRDAAASPVTSRDAEAAQREVDRMAQALQQVPDAKRIRNLREVRDAAEECLVRLRL